MKTLTCISCALLLTVSTPVLSKGSPWYFAIKGGFMDAGTGIADNAINGGFDIGYQNNRYLATEIEYTRSLIDGETSSGNDWDVDTLSAFASFRSNTKVKFKGKVGLTHIDTGNNDDIEFSMGIGIGFWALGGLTEIEYTELGNDNELNFFSVGVNYYF
ncbi:MAG: porin family protein [Gammaproteobacteria bacterium]|nr:porin family protein [Gammaproteobacteria bacterium]